MIGRRRMKERGAKRYDSFLGSDLWLPPRLWASPLIETILTVLAQEMTE